MAQALKEHNVPFAHHVFSTGKHGLSLADEGWAKGEYGEPYTMDQVNKLLEAIRTNSFPIPDEVKKQLLEAFDYSEGRGQKMLAGNIPNDEVIIWPALVHAWLMTIYIQSPKDF